jgi:predicted metal-dependent peptidase
MTPQDRVTKSHIAIMRSPEFCMFSGVLSVGKVIFSDKLPTAGTNGRDVTYNPEFIDSLTDSELNFIVLHEALHKAFQHMHMWKALFKDNPQLTNMAADYVVNASILDAQANSSRPMATMPEGGLYDKKYANMTTKQIYTLLKEQQDKDGRPPEGRSLDEHDFEGASELTEQEKTETREAIDKALRQGEIIRGKLGGNTNRDVDKILKPKVDWRGQLREFMTSICRAKDYSTWRRPSKRFLGQDIYMPSTVGESMGDLVVAIDTSGSIGSKELQVFLSEVVSVCSDVRPKKVDLLYWDSEVERHEVYEEGQYESLFGSTKPSGGGGTHVGCVNAYIQEKNLAPEAVVILTDGYVESDWGGSWQHPTLWVITSSDMLSPHGKSIHLDTNN